MSWIFSKRPHNNVESLDSCLNCATPLSSNDYYCPSCGQKKQSSRITLWELVKDFIISILNLENGFYRSLKYLFIPGKLPREFIDGRRKSYFNPIRLFVIFFIIHIAVIGSIIQYDAIKTSNINNERLLGQYELLLSLDTLAGTPSLPYTREQIDSLKKNLFSRAVDLKTDTSNFFSDFLVIPGIIDLHNYHISKLDAYSLSPDEIIEKYAITDFAAKIIISQIIRANKDLAGMVRFGIGNLIWCLFLTILALGGIMKLLYIRTKRYFVEHLILLFHVHAAGFIVGTIGLLVDQYIRKDINNGWFGLALLLTALLFFLDIKFYYQQGWIKSLVKYFIIIFFYFVLLCVMLMLVGMISFLIYK